MIGKLIVAIYSAAVLSAVARDDAQMFRDKLLSTLNYHVPMVLMDNVDDEDALAFLMTEIKKGFGAVSETRPLSDQEESLLSKIKFISPRSDFKVSFHQSKISLRNLTNEICGQLKMNLVVLLDGSFNFIPLGVKLDPSEYEHEGFIYVQIIKSTSGG